MLPHPLLCHRRHNAPPLPQSRRWAGRAARAALAAISRLLEFSISNGILARLLVQGQGNKKTLSSKEEFFYVAHKL
jgi:hypothetical protein